MPLVVPGQSTVSSSSSASASLASLPQDTSDDSSSSPAITRRRSANIPASGKPTETPKHNVKKDTGTRTGKQVVRFARVDRGVHGKSQRRNGVSIKGHTRKHFSRFRFGTSYKSGIEEAQYLCSLPEQHKFRNVQEDENDKGAPCRRRTCDAVPRAENFDWTTADHNVLSEGCESRYNNRYAVVVVIQDLANHLIQSAPCEIKTSQETNRILRKFLEPSEKPKVIFSDIFWNLAKPVKIYHGIIVHQRVTDLRRMVLLREPQAKLKEVSAVMLQSGLDGECWADSMEYYPISVTDQSRLHPFGKKVLSGLFLGCALYAGWNSEG